MNTRLVLASPLGLAVLLWTAASAAADPLELYFRNVREYHHDNGEVHRFYLERDHTFAMKVEGKTIAGGTWTYSAGKDELCTRITTPNPPPPPPGLAPDAPRCQPAHTTYRPGVWWTERMANGMTERQVFMPRP